MALYLVQHGKAHPAEIDPERGLTDDGLAEVERIAAVARGYGVKVSAVIHSGKKRASQTAMIFAETLAPRVSPAAVSGMDPGDDVIRFAAGIDASADIMYVGHLPFMEKLTSYLITGSEGTPVFRFQNGGIVCLDIHPDTGTWIIKWTLMPHIG
ncbi:MAG: phosphohistidine phosphatase SixA [Spirochaetes bacterium]|nr:phosphohistidine phosphatase SixA [Spirochaetota bacterium]